jgi:hypothetical protein
MPDDKTSLISQMLELYKPGKDTEFGHVSVETVDAWLKSHANPYPPVCAVCQNQRWNVSGDILQLPFWWAQTIPPRNYTYPVVALTCTRCGNVLVLNAVTLGVVPPAGA